MQEEEYRRARLLVEVSSHVVEILLADKSSQAEIDCARACLLDARIRLEELLKRATPDERRQTSSWLADRFTESWKAVHSSGWIRSISREVATTSVDLLERFAKAGAARVKAQSKRKQISRESNQLRQAIRSWRERDERMWDKWREIVETSYAAIGRANDAINRRC